MESIEKLRKKIKCLPTPKIVNELQLAAIDALIDEIQAEIAELQPLDADGVPTHVGDVVAAQDEQPFKVRAFQLDELGWFAIERLGSQWNLNQLHHVKPDPVKELLEEFANNGTPTGNGGVLFEAGLIEQYAERIRQAVES